MKLIITLTLFIQVLVGCTSTYLVSSNPPSHSTSSKDYVDFITYAEFNDRMGGEVALIQFSNGTRRLGFDLLMESTSVTGKDIHSSEFFRIPKDSIDKIVTKNQLLGAAQGAAPGVLAAVGTLALAKGGPGPTAAGIILVGCLGEAVVGGFVGFIIGHKDEYGISDPSSNVHK